MRWSVLDQGRPARSADLYAESGLLAPYFLLTMKPTVHTPPSTDAAFTTPPLAAVEALAAS